MSVSMRNRVAVGLVEHHFGTVAHEHNTARENPLFYPDAHDSVEMVAQWRSPRARSRTWRWFLDHLIAPEVNPAMNCLDASR